MTHARYRSRLVMPTGLAAIAGIIALVVILAAPSHGRASTQAPSQGVLEHYAVFSRQARAGDNVLASNYREPQSATALTRQQPSSDQAVTQWAAVEGAEMLCVIDSFASVTRPNGAPDTNSSCDAASYMESHHEILVQASLIGTASGTPPAQKVANLISGLVPNGVSSVTLGFSGEVTKTVPVSENGFVYSLGSSPRKLESVTWVQAGTTFHEK